MIMVDAAKVDTPTHKNRKSGVTRNTMIWSLFIVLALNLVSINDCRLSYTYELKNAARNLNVNPPWNAPAWAWKHSWNVQHSLLPLLHFFDKTGAKESFVNLSVLWWKAIAGNRWGTATFDNGIAFDLLPPLTRWIVAFPLCWLFPNLHHQNVALRTAYIDRALNSIYQRSKSQNRTMDVIVMGAGFDSRSVRFLNLPVVKEYAGKGRFIEVDLPSVTQQKSKMFERLLRRRKSVTQLPSLLEADLNQPEQCKVQLSSLDGSPKSHAVTFIFEAVLLYLEPGKASQIIQLCCEHAKARYSDCNFVFADRFPEVRIPEFAKQRAHESLSPPEEAEIERRDVEKFLMSTGLTMNDWLPKPGKARHMCLARL